MSRIAIVLGAVITALVVAGALLLVYDSLSAPPIVIDDLPRDGTIVVEITGAVGTPGVYEVSADARIADVIVAAGGTRPDADLGALNLARRVYDEDELVIPSRQSPTPAPTVGARRPTPTPSPAPTVGTGPGPTPTIASDETRRVNINTADVGELDTLPGIGPVLAQRIIDYRTEQGPFQTVDELEEVRGISATMVGELRPLITVDE